MCILRKGKPSSPHQHADTWGLHLAVENLRLQGELRDLQRDMDAEEVAALRADVDATRIQLLRTAEQLQHLQSTPVVLPSLAALG